MYRVYWNQASAAYLSLYFVVFFLSNFQTLKFLITLFSGTVRPGRLILGTHVDSGQMYRVYRNQAAAAYLSLYFFIFLSLQFTNIKIFRHSFLRNCEAWKVDTWYTRGQWADVSCIPESGCCCCLFIPVFLHFPFSPIFKHLKFSSHFSQELWGLEGWNLVHMWTVGRCIVCTRIRLLLLICPFISSVFFLSNFQTLKIFVALFSGTVRPIKFKLDTHMDNGWMYRVYRSWAAASYLSLISLFFFLCSVQKLKSFRHTFLRNCYA